MTTVIYAHGILATDKRTTTTAPGESECSDCGSKESRVSNASVKLHVLKADKDIKFRDEKLIAYARAGRVSISRVLGRLVEEGKDVEDYIRQTKSLIPSNGRSVIAGLLIVTDKNVYRLEYDTGDVTVEERGKDKVTAIGSGKRVAYFMTRMFGLGAIDAIKAAAFSDRATGGGVNWVDCNAEERKIQLEPIAPVGELKVELWKSMGEIINKPNALGLTGSFNRAKPPTLGGHLCTAATCLSRKAGGPLEHTCIAEKPTVTSKAAKKVTAKKVATKKKVTKPQ